MALVLHTPKHLHKGKLVWTFLWVQFPPWTQIWVRPFQPCALQIAAGCCNLGQGSSGAHCLKVRWEHCQHVQSEEYYRCFLPWLVKVSCI